MKAFSPPALLIAAGEMSAKAQSFYLNLIRLEYFFLFIAAVLSLDLSDSRLYYSAYAAIFVFSLSVLIIRSTIKPEQEWYKGRALAESIKTTTWRYCMRAAPFDDAPNIKTVKSEFRNFLKSVLESNRHIGDKIPSNSAAEDQITISMDEARGLPLNARKDYYLNNRIKDQRNWYQIKATANKRWSRAWMFIGILTYTGAFASVMLRINFPEWKIWPTDALIVLASSFLGWIQIKKFNELAASYTLTAHEIGILQGRISDIEDEKNFSSFINEAELAFSREHTQWVARQQA
jgi:hypothetical protein